MVRSVGITGWILAAMLLVGFVAAQSSREPLVNRGGTSSQTSTEKLDAVSLKKMVDGLGYTTKNLSSKPGDEQYEFEHETEAMDVPMVAQVSPSTNFVWLSVYIGKSQPLSSANSTNFHKLLMVNADIQPCHFYVTESGGLYMAIGVDNRGITAQILKARITKIAEDCADNRDLWRTLVQKSE